MNRELRDRWLAALRSGEYPQTYGVLRRLQPGMHTVRVDDVDVTVDAPIGFCCLGVLSDVCVQEWPDKFQWIDGGDGEGSIEYPGWSYDMYDELAMIPGSAVTSGELDVLGQILRVNDDEPLLILRNDTGRDSFAAIADWIEEHIPADDVPLPFLINC